MRAQALLHGLGEPEGASEDLSMALLLDQVVNHSDYGQMSTRAAKMLFNRAECYDQLGDYHKAIEDLKTCCSVVRTHGKKKFEDDPRCLAWLPGESVMLLLTVMAKQKVQEGTSRPFYTKEEAEKIMMDLGLEQYDKATRYRCDCCDKNAENSALLRCSRCHTVWYCSKECQIKMWKAHSLCCNQSPQHFFCDDSSKVEMELEVQEKGFTYSHSVHGQPRIFLRDPITGRLFNPLTNADVFFMPQDTLKGIRASLVKKADRTDTKQFLRFVSGEVEGPKQYDWTEIGWISQRVMGYPTIRDNAEEMVKAATALMAAVHDRYRGTPTRAWIAVLILLTACCDRSWAFHQMDRHGKAMDDATRALSFVEMMETWLEDTGPASASQRVYFQKYKALILMHRGIQKKFLKDYAGAVEDLRECLSITRHLSFEPPLPNSVLGMDQKTNLDNLKPNLQMVLTLQKMALSAPRPFFSAVDRAAIMEELGLERDFLAEEDGPLVDSNGMGDWDPWTFRSHGVFACEMPIIPANHSRLSAEEVRASLRYEWRIIVPDGEGGHFESISDVKVCVLSKSEVEELAKKNAAAKMMDTIQKSMAELFDSGRKDG